MSRIFPSLASLSLGLFLAAVVIGLSLGDLYQRPLSETTIRWKGIHMLTGTSAALAVVFVHSIAVTYFIGTSRWCKEVTETYQLEAQALQMSTRLKRTTFPWCLLGMVAVVGYLNISTVNWSLFRSPCKSHPPVPVGLSSQRPAGLPPPPSARIHQPSAPCRR